MIPGVVTQVGNCSPEDVEAGGLGAQGHPQRHGEFDSSLGYMCLSLGNKLQKDFLITAVLIEPYQDN